MIYVLEPYAVASHLHWTTIFSEKNGFRVKHFTLPGYHWKWRMHAAAIQLAEAVSSEPEPEHIIISEMCDVAVFKALLPRHWTCKLSVYFHENQITFPWKPDDQDLKLERNNHYAFINFTSALAADRVVFNSHFHRSEFLTALPQFLGQFPEHLGEKRIHQISKKSTVIPIHIPVSSATPGKWEASAPVILWNHRWEYDKNPEVFFKMLYRLKTEKCRFKLAVLGGRGKTYPDIFQKAESMFKEETIYWGYLKDKTDYHTLMRSAHILPVTSVQDFFGISALEAIEANVYPLLPNRLAFPEHFQQSEHLYDTDEQLENRLRDILLNWDARRKDCENYAVHLREHIHLSYAENRIAELWKTHLKNED